MTNYEIDKEFKMLKEYMNVYIQLLPYCRSCRGNIIHEPQMPTFKYFKEVYSDVRYSLAIPHYKESKTIINKTGVINNYTHGLSVNNRVIYRYYNMWMGCKYFTGCNINGDYIINNFEVNKLIK